jgi:hypothetical protein
MQFSVAIKCPGCGQAGTVVWEEDDGNQPGKRAARRLVSVSGGFHTQTGRTESGDPAIVCDVCDCIQPD